MARRTLNVGIVAHVDAGKTTLTERLLYAAGVVSEIGSVDAGTTQTDSMSVERQRGITIRSAAASFTIGDVTVNLLDTPGHPDFIAEVERVLSVLDGAVLVISAVEGVQPQTRVLLRALQRLNVPTVFFVNKIDRAGAGYDQVLDALAKRLTPAIVPMGAVDQLGTAAAVVTPFDAEDLAHRPELAEVLSSNSDELLAAFVDGVNVSPDRLRDELTAQTKRSFAHPVFFGSAITGVGTAPLIAGLVELLPTTSGGADGPSSGSVFKVERGAAGDKIAYVRMFTGTLRARDRPYPDRAPREKVTAIGGFEGGSIVRRGEVRAGEIAKVWGLKEVRVGDAIGQPPPTAGRQHFAPPTLASIVTPREPEAIGRLRVALARLAEQDPLINVRQNDIRQEITVALYGEVQKEVIQATLADQFGVDVTFCETTTICVERPVGVGEAVEFLGSESNPFPATVGLRVEPAPVGVGIEFRLDVDNSVVPMYAYRSMVGFAEGMGSYVRHTLREGLFGWEVIDAVVTMTDCEYRSGDGPPAKRGPRSVPIDYRNLTPFVLMQALERAGTRVCEPMLAVHLELPTHALGPILTALARLGVGVQEQTSSPELSVIEAALPAARVPQLHRQLPGLTGGEGVLESRFRGYQPVRSEPPNRQRTMADPRNRTEYVASLARY